MLYQARRIITYDWIQPTTPTKAELFSRIYALFQLQKRGTVCRKREVETKNSKQICGPWIDQNFRPNIYGEFYLMVSNSWKDHPFIELI